MTDIHDNSVANVTIGANGAQPCPKTPTKAPEVTPCEIVPDAQPQPTAEEAPASQLPLKLTAQELNAMHLLKEAGFLNKNYQFYTKDDQKQRPKLRVLNQSEKVMVSQTLGKLFSERVPAYEGHVQRYCIGHWQMTASKQTLSNDCSRFKREHKARADAFQQEIDQILLPINKNAR